MNYLERIDCPIRELPSGDILTVSLYTIRGNEPGPHVHIQANVHGAELQGNAVIFELMSYFLNNQFKGSVTFVPCANPFALNQKMGAYTYGRFNPVTGDNWNRTYEDILAKDESEIDFSLDQFVKAHLHAPWDEIKRDFKSVLAESFLKFAESQQKYGINDSRQVQLLLQNIAAKADIVLDLHTGPIATRYIYSADYLSESAKNFLFPHMLIIPPEFTGAMDEASFIPWVKLHKAFKDMKRDTPLEFESYTLELGSEEVLNFAEAEDCAMRVLNYLKSKKMIVDEIGPFDDIEIYTCLLEDFKTYHAPYGGLVEYLKAPGEMVQKGDIMARFLNFKKVKNAETLPDAIWEFKAPDDCIIINHYSSGSVIQGSQLFQVMENYAPA